MNRTFFELGVEERLKGNRLLLLNKLIDWQEISCLLQHAHIRGIGGGGGKIGYDKLMMYKAVLLGQWHSLSDPKLEEALRVRLDFMKFIDLELGSSVPDETTLCRFRNKLISLGLDVKLLAAINRELERLGLKVERAEAAVVDATIIESSARPRRVVEMSIDREEDEAVASLMAIEESVDKEARWLKKGKRSYYGYKGFVATDGEDGYITQVDATPANVSEVKYFEAFSSTIEAGRILSDKGNASHNNRALLKARGIKNGIMYKALKNKPLRSSQKLFNKLISKRRYIVEQCFGTLKRIFQMCRASYLGLRKVAAQLRFKAMCFNLNKALNKALLAN
jgi:IS5 family transposase